MYFRFITLSLFLISFKGLASSSLVLPQTAELLTLSIQNEEGLWNIVEPQSIGENTYAVAQGNYRFTVALPEAIGSIKDGFVVTGNQKFYLHRTMSGDNQKVFSWVSTSKPLSEDFKKEKLQKFCENMSRIHYESYQVVACQSLAEDNDGIGLHGLGKTLGYGLLIEEDREQAKTYFKRAFQEGHMLSAVDFYYLDVDDPEARSMLKKAAELENLWAQGAYANELAFGPEIDKSLAKSYALKAARQGNLDGLATLARIGTVYSAEGYSAIETAAWYRLYRVSNGGTGTFGLGLVSDINDALTDKDEPKVMAQAKVLEKAHFDSSPQLIVAAKTFAPLASGGAIKLIFNNDFQLDINTKFGGYQIRMIEPYVSHNLDLEVAGDYASNLRFLPYEVGASQMCLFYDAEMEELAVQPLSENSFCKETEVASLWEHLKEFTF